MHRRRTLVPVTAAVLALVAAQALAPAPAAGQSAGDLVKAARERQRDFELFRQSRIPLSPPRTGGGCDQNIGRICIWFGGEDEADFPPERPEVGLARGELLQLLARVGRQVRDPWVLGQQVHYLAESGNLDGAEQAARACGIDETSWCSALTGYALHLKGDVVAAEAAFAEALAAMPEKERARWMTPTWIVSRDVARDFERADPADRARRWYRFWRLSDPLVMVEGNDRLTDHYARLVEARNQRDAENPQGMFWEEDLEETLVRYGRIVGYSRTAQRRSPMGPRGGFNLQDTRSVIGHHQPMSRGYLFPEQFLESPADVPPESWITAPREARTWYAPPYAPDMRGLETQVGRFRRGDEMLVVGAYRPGDGGGAGADVRSGLFLLDLERDRTVEVRGTEAEGVVTLRTEPGRYVSSLEVFDPEARRAWRARQGVRQDSLVFGVVAVSDLMLLAPDAPFPASLEEAVPHVRRGVRLARGERFTLVWEVYGLGVAQPAQVTVGFTRGRPGFLERVGDFLGVIEPDEPVEVTFEDPGTDAVQSAFRALTLELPDLEPGDYTLHLRLDLPGRTPALASRPIVVEG